MRRWLLTTCAAAIAVSLVLASTPRSPAAASGPFAVAASVGPDAGSRVDATVTRLVHNVPVTLPAAIVPALAPGDAVTVRFPDYTRPPARANYHVNVAFITEAAPQRWLYEKSGPWDQLFSNDHRRRTPFHPKPLHFVYGQGDHRGIPIFFIVPEDAKTRGMDGVRDYVDAHPTDFKNMSESANVAVARYSWFHDFLQSLGQGSLDPVSARQRVEDVASSLGASPSSIDACYTAGGTQAEVANCIQTTLISVQYQTNIEAPTMAQFFGGVAGAASPVQFAFYLEPLLAIWQIFSRIGHQEYEYLPAALALTHPAAGAPFGRELLMGAKVPTLRPPAAQSSVLFFTIGDANAAQNAPHVVDDATSAGMCARTDRVALPLHLDQTSPYVNDTALVVTPDRGAPFTVPLDPRTLGAPVVRRSRLDRGADAETVRLAGRFGFDSLAQARSASVRIAWPHATAWTLVPAPHRPPLTGGSLEVIASSAEAPCLSRAELQIGSAPPLALTVKHLDDRRVELRASLQKVPPGEAQIRLDQDDPLHRTVIENAVALTIEHAPAHVASRPAPTAALRDRSVRLAGSGFEEISALRLGGTTYGKDPGSTADLACFSGPPIGGKGFEPGASVSARLLADGSASGEVFTVRLAPPRPVLQRPVVVPDTPLHLSTDPLQVFVHTAGGALPAEREIRIRHARPAPTPCDADAGGEPYAVVPASAVHEVNGSELAVVLRPAEELGDRAFGTVQIQVVDTRTKSASDWVDLPGTFARAPSVSRIECPPDPSAPCTLLGTGLAAIAGVEAPSGRFIAPSADCTSDQKGLACLTVPHLARYTLRLTDSGTTFPLPAALISAPPRPSPSPAPAPTPSPAPLRVMLANR